MAYRLQPIENTTVGVHVAYRGVFDGLQLCPGGFMHFGFGLPGVSGNS